MSKTKRQVTLQDATIAGLEALGFDSLSIGIETLFRDRNTHTGATHAPTRSHRTALQDLEGAFDDEPTTPKVHHMTAAKDAKVSAAREVYLTNRKAYFRDICLRIYTGAIQQAHLELYMADFGEANPKGCLTADEMWDIHAEVQADEDGSSAAYKNQYWTERSATAAKQKASHEQYKQDIASGMTHAQAMGTKPQTLRLSAKALKGLSMFGTPETMTDEQITETNLEWEHGKPDYNDEDGEVTYI